MLRIQGLRSEAFIVSGTVRGASAVGLVLALGIATSGCSTDFRRLENPGLTQGERAPLPSATLSTRRNAGAPIAQENWSDSGSRAPLPPVTSNPRPVLGAAPPTTAPLPNVVGLSKPFDRPKAAVTAAPAAGAKVPAPTGQTVEVQPGDSLYAIAKRNNVSIADLMDANGLKSPALKPGQKLALPAASSLRRPVTKPGTQVASAGGALPPSAVAPSAPAPSPVGNAAAATAAVNDSDWAGSYTLKPGDSLYAIARTHKVKLADLQRVNAIADATKVRPGTVLKVPAAGTTPAMASAQPAVAQAAAAPRAAPIAAAPNMPTAMSPGATNASAGPIVTPRIINMQQAQPKSATDGGTASETQVAAVAPVAPVAPVVSAPLVAPNAGAKAGDAKVASAASAGGKFRWPVNGQTIAGFGKRPDGVANDGINIAVPAGTEIHAASDGIVAYAGSELKGFGNLILLRHDGGYVTAYAHASELLAKRGDTIKRGQVIAKAGQSGGVDKPQVHFELRKDSQPIDPTPYMDKM
jgi:murein DD-endopeptidase MepM/ murein hydrolase activator NlpD